jgi:WD40 repeat protein
MVISPSGTWPEQSVLARPWFSNSAEITTIAFSPQGDILASGDQGGTLLLWDLREHRIEGRLTSGSADPFNPISHLLFGHDDAHLASAQQIPAGSAVTLWNVDAASWASAACAVVAPLTYGKTGYSPNLEYAGLCD